MQEYYFLFGLALVWLAVASIQDIKTREVDNWLTFSLIIFALAYRAIYSYINNNPWFFISGAIGFAAFFLLANLFYYSGIFAGGDAKLLMGVGATLPFFPSFYSASFSLISFLLILFSVGAVYTLIYTFFLVYRDFSRFRKSFSLEIKKVWKFLIILLAVFLIANIVLKIDEIIIVLSLLVIAISPLLYAYTKAVENSCLIRKVKARELREGDWLYASFRVGGRIIEKSVHGLSKEDIRFLKKKRAGAEIKEGVPFVPVFLISYLIMLYVFLILRIDWVQVFSSLS